MKKIKYYLILLLICIIILPANALAKTIYVDNTLSSNITNGSYSIANRNSSGSSGNAYANIQAAIAAMSPGDHIVLRGGTYTPGSGNEECIDIPVSKNGTSWEEGEYNKISSYHGEWAVIDGQNNCGSRGVVIGHYSPDFDDPYDIKYWMFERIEIKNGRTSSGDFASGFCGNGGPFIFRYCYIHDNQATTPGNNPAGLKGWHIQDSTIEYCYFDNNGIAAGINDNDDNPANITFYSDYDAGNIAKNGFDDNNSRRPVARNIIRYNYFKGSNDGIKYKGSQFFSGRNPDGGHGWSDEKKHYGDEIHNNIIISASAFGIACQQDFAQVYKNIIVDCGVAIAFRYQPSAESYKAVSYNNAIISPRKIGLVRYGNNALSDINDPKDHFGWDYNNIFDTAGGYTGWCTTKVLNVIPYGSTCSSGIIFNLSSYYCSNNYFYRSKISDVFRLTDTSLTVSSFNNQTLTASPRIAYCNDYNSSDTLYQGSSGADKYKTRSAHMVDDSKTLANAGIGVNHPYLSGVTIPSYIGATNPNDNFWVAGVLSLENISVLMNSGAGDPSWIEGGG
ncbi:MAG: hypothetical protein K8R79_11010, partial [Calditrichales bacterium]|nr:hypothetical protein [Calditrichales bacterium]